MPSISRTIGDDGEEVAFFNLKKRGYKILERNYINKIGEIDIIASKNKKIIFVDVKSQYEPEASGLYPERSVDWSKQRKLIRVAQSYLIEKKYPDDTDWQIDVIGVVLNTATGRANLRHLKNAVSM
jgi:putative endonuclease